MPYHSKWIFIKYVDSSPYYPNEGNPELFETITVLLPEYVVRQVPQYQSKLDAELAKPNYNENLPITIEDDHMHYKDVHNDAVQFFASGFLPKLGGDEPACMETMETLTLLYDFSVLMGAEMLELAVIKHMDEFEGLTLTVFLDFARNYYGYGGNSHDDEGDSLALLIKKMLVKFVPQIIKRKMVQEI